MHTYIHTHIHLNSQCMLEWDESGSNMEKALKWLNGTYYFVILRVYMRVCVCVCVCVCVYIYI
jgi:hypothetical protein